MSAERNALSGKHGPSGKQGATAAAAAVVRATPLEAHAFGSSVIGQEHILLALGDQPGCLAGLALTALGVDPSSTRSGLGAMVGTTGILRTREGRAPTPTSRLLRALEEADAEAEEHGRPTTTADLLLGILRTHQGVGFQLLGYAGIREDKLRAELEGVIAGHPELDDVEPTTVRALIDSAT